MSASPTITIFNANTLTIEMQVNSGPGFQIAGASGPGWLPQSPLTGGPTWSNGEPGQNVLAPGDNYLTISPGQGIEPFVTKMTLPANQQFDSLQLYIFFNTYSSVSWIVLNEGAYLTGNLSLANTQTASPA